MNTRDEPTPCPRSRGTSPHEKVHVKCRIAFSARSKLLCITLASGLKTLLCVEYGGSVRLCKMFFAPSSRAVRQLKPAGLRSCDYDG